MMKQLLREILFWTHVVLMMGAILVGLLLPFWAFAVLAFFHRVHMHVFRGCLFSHLQKRLDCMPKDQTFIQHMMERFFRRPFNLAEANAVDMMILLGALGIAFGHEFVM